MLKLSDGGLLCSADNRILKSSNQGQTWTVVCGCSYPGFADGVGTSALFNHPEGLAVDSSGKYLYICDVMNNRIRRAELSTGTVTTFAGSGKTDGPIDGLALEASLNCPRSLIVFEEDLMISTASGYFEFYSPISSVDRLTCMSVIRSIMPVRMSEWVFITIGSYLFDAFGTFDLSADAMIERMSVCVIGWVSRTSELRIDTFQLSSSGRTLTVTAGWLVLDFKPRAAQVRFDFDTESVDGEDLSLIRFDTPTAGVFDPADHTICYVIDRGSNSIRKIEWPDPPTDD